MLRTNLSTRPFYNERVVHLLIALAAVIVLTITLFNVVTVVDLSRHNTELSTTIAHDRAEADRLAEEAVRIRHGINKNELTVVAAAAREANGLIDQRTFSWTAFFNHLEATLPADVMLSSVRPTVDSGATHISMVVLGRSAADIDEFIEKLEATGAFDRVLARQTDKTDAGLTRSVLDAVYTPEDEEPAPAEAGKPGAPATPGKSTAAPKAGTAATPGASAPGTARPSAERPKPSPAAPATAPARGSVGRS